MPGVGLDQQCGVNKRSVGGWAEGLNSSFFAVSKKKILIPVNLLNPLEPPFLSFFRLSSSRISQILRIKGASASGLEGAWPLIISAWASSCPHCPTALAPWQGP